MVRNPKRLVFCFKCPDRPGILAAISPIVSQCNWDIREANVYGDPQSGAFFVRMVIAGSVMDEERLSEALRTTLEKYNIECDFADPDRPLKTIIAVSKTDHCLNDLLYKVGAGLLPIEVCAVVSNHENLKSAVELRGVSFVHAPVTPETRAGQELQLMDLMKTHDAQLLILARYMQVLSDRSARALYGRCINIHHSFLPSFKGARPYHQAHERGVKLIGATAHYVTSDLDEGPIIEQDVRRVSHAATSEQLVQIGQEVEASVLSRAVLWHAERRVFLNGSRTVVFS